MHKLYYQKTIEEFGFSERTGYFHSGENNIAFPDYSVYNPWDGKIVAPLYPLVYGGFIQSVEGSLSYDNDGVWKVEDEVYTGCSAAVWGGFFRKMGRLTDTPKGLAINLFVNVNDAALFTLENPLEISVCVFHSENISVVTQAIFNEYGITSFKD